MDWYRSHGKNARATCRHFGISPDTFYRWWRHWDPGNLASLEDDRLTRRPYTVRKPTTPPEVVQRIKELREHYPRWGKAKLVVLLHREGYTVSESTVGRTLKRLKASGKLIEPLMLVRARAQRRRRRPWARRYRREDAPRRPGELVEIDTLDREIVANVRRKQFTARDRVSKWDVVEAYSRATSGCARRFLETLLERTPFRIRAIQVDGGSEFMAEFESSCQKKKIELIVLPPRSPNLNGGVERANRTHTEEFYEVENVGLTLPEHNAQLKAHEQVYNTIRPHQALGQKTPLEFLGRWPTLYARAQKVYGI